MKTLCHEYLEGTQWVLSYYTMGVPNWKWFLTIIMHLPHLCWQCTLIRSSLKIMDVLFLQLLINNYFAYYHLKARLYYPPPLDTLLTSESSPLKEHCPEEFTIDLAGKRKEWEGIVILPMVDFELVRNTYMQHIDKLNIVDKKRNMLGRAFLYHFSKETKYEFRSYYGDISDCKVTTSIIDL